MKSTFARHFLAVLLAAVMTIGLGAQGVLAEGAPENGPGITWEELDPSEVSADLLGQGEAVEENGDAPYKDTDVVRALIIMDKTATITRADINTVQNSDLYDAYRQVMTVAQAITATRISDTALDGEEMDVVWSFDLLADAISVNVEYGKLDEIAKIRGVRGVVLEQRYELTDRPNNVTAQEMTGTDGVRAGETPFYGAGTSVAIIDTGLAVDHISFDEGAFKYALAEDAEKAGMDYDAYTESLGLLTKEKVAAALEAYDLHVEERAHGITAEELYKNLKVPFAFDYANGSADVSHLEGGGGDEHGSHVAGIAAANRYVPAVEVYDMDGNRDFDVNDAQKLLNLVIRGEKVEHPLFTDLDNDGELTAYDAYLLLLQVENGEADIPAYVPAAQSVRVDGVAPEAQIFAMKILSASGGIYSSDYIAALEDAVMLGADVSNLSLGSAQPGFSKAHNEVGDESGELIDETLNTIFKEAADSGMIVSVSAGNNGNWADYDDAYQLMYADEGGVGNLGAPGSYSDVLAVASVENTGSTTDLTTVATNADGSKRLELFPEALIGNPTEWTALDQDGVGKKYGFVFLGDPTGLLVGGAQEDMRIYGGNSSDFDGVDYRGKIVVIARGNQVNFIVKHELAAAAGAAAVIIYNNEDGSQAGFTVAGTEGTLDTPGTPPTTATIPIVSISLEKAKELFALADGKDGVYSGSITVSRRFRLTEPAEDAKPEMSYYSSWGTTGDLTIKPEITAPGGNIMSVNGFTTDNYEVMSGTSMSAPHLAGLAALGLNYVTANSSAVLNKAQALQAGIQAGNLVQSLLMSTAVPIKEYEDIEYSVRFQGAGLANIENVVKAQSFLTVTGAEYGKVKAELGDSHTTGADEDSVFTFEFTVNNLTGGTLTYDLSDSLLTTDVTTQDRHALATNEMVRLGAKVTYAGEGVDGSTLTVDANGSATVTVTITVPASEKAIRSGLGFTNGFYVEGFIYLQGEGLVTHSIPLLGWRGDWTDPSMYDVNDFISLFYDKTARPSHIPAESGYKNMLTYAPIEDDSEGYPFSGNLYNQSYVAGMSEDEYIEARNAANSIDPKWTFYAVFPTLIRAAGDFNIYITGVTADGKADPDTIYYEDTMFSEDDRTLKPSFFYANEGAWWDVTGQYGIGIEWDFTDKDGKPLADGTKFMVSLVTVPEYNVRDSFTTEEHLDLTPYLNSPGAALSWTFTVDNEKPEIVENVVDGVDKTIELLAGDKLTFKVRDNRQVAAVVLLNGAANMAVQYTYPNMSAEPGQEKYMQIELGDYRKTFGDKLVLVVADYAGNETYYAVNLNGAGTSYGEFVGVEFDGWGNSSWVSFDQGADRDEIAIFGSDGEVAAAEYVNGMVFFQTTDGKLYGIPYEDMLGNKVDLEASLITQLAHVYQDMAYSYKDGRLYAMYVTEADEYSNGETHFDAIYLQDDYINGYSAYDVEEEAVTATALVFGLTLACDDEGSLYVIGQAQDLETFEWTDTAHLFKFTGEDTGWYVSWTGKDLGDTGLTLDYRQSATWNHNDETLYWARFVPSGVLDVTSELYKVSTEDGTCVQVATLDGELSGLFAPLTEETAGKETHTNVPVFDREEKAQPVLSDSELTMNVGSMAKLSVTFDPWYSNYKNITWTSDNEGVVTVDQNGLVTAVAPGNATITVTNNDAGYLYAECTVNVASLSLSIEGYVSTSAGLGSIASVNKYTLDISEGVGTFTKGEAIRAAEDVVTYGLDLASSVVGKNGEIWACEWGNNGMIYRLNEKGEVLEMLEPIDGDMMYGLAYSKELDKYMGIMNAWFYVDVDLPYSDETKTEMENSWNEVERQYDWHRVDMTSFLEASRHGLTTPDGESGNMSAITFAAITSIPVSGEMVEFSGDAFGGYSSSGGYYTPDATWVLLDNVGRLWYIDEVAGMTLEDLYEDGTLIYTRDDWSQIPSDSDCVFTQEYTAEDGSTTYNVFAIRQILETPLYDTFLRDGLGITYTFNDMQYVGDYDGYPMFVFSLYRYWDSAESNDLYFYLQDVVEYMDPDTYEFVTTRGSLYSLGSLDRGLIIATINSAEYINGLPKTTVDVTFHSGDLVEGDDIVLTFKKTETVEFPSEYEFAIYGWNVPEDVAFIGWVDENNVPVEDLWNVTPKDGMEFTAVWEKKVAVTFDPGDLTEYVPDAQRATAYYSSRDTSLPNEYFLSDFGWDIPENLKFVGWKNSDGELVGPYDEVAFEEGMTFTAVWEELTAVVFRSGLEGVDDITLYFSEDDFELPTGYQIAYLLHWTVPKTHTFAGWKDKEGNDVDVENVPELTEGLEFTANWTVRKLGTETGIDSIYVYIPEGSGFDVHMKKYDAAKTDDDNWVLKLPIGIEKITEYDISVDLTDTNLDEWTNLEIVDNGDDTFDITVTAEDGETTHTYTLTVTYDA